MRRISITVLLLGLLLADICLAQVKVGGTIKVGPTVKIVASTPVTDFEALTTFTLGTLRNDFDGYTGLRFITHATTPPVITTIGCWKVSGNTGTTNAYLFDNSNNQLRTVSVDLGAGTAGTCVYGANFTTPYTSSASEILNIFCQRTNGGNQWYDDDTTPTGIRSGVFLNDTTGSFDSVFTSSLPSSGSTHADQKTYGPVCMKVQ